jgi:hypothetical protein
LYNTSGCSTAQCAQIANAVTAAQNAANGQGIVASFLKSLIKALLLAVSPDKARIIAGLIETRRYISKTLLIKINAALYRSTLNDSFLYCSRHLAEILECL